MRFAPEILRRLGEELVPHPDLGIIELVRNSYDADATKCVIELINVETPGGTIKVSDVGDGMTPREIHDGFLLLGRSGKVDSEYTPGGRRKVGEKGLGRLAALRLGRQVELRTRPRSEPGVEYQLVINWDLFESAVAVEDIDLTIIRAGTTEPPGTTIEISNVATEFTNNDVERLARSLVMLTGPFPNSNTGFKAELRSPEFSAMEKLVGHGFFEICDFVLRARLNVDGAIVASLVDRHGKVLAEAETDKVIRHSPDYRAGATPQFMSPPAAQLELWMFNLNTVSYGPDGHRIPGLQKTVSNWLKQFGGLHLYHRGLRVHPYGDPGNDWVAMNALRTSNPELRPATNTSVGRVILGDGENRLVPKTDRSGYVENLSFRELREFIRAVLEWAATTRIQWRDRDNAAKKKTVKTKIKEAQDAVDRALQSAPRETRQIVRKAVQQEREAFQERIAVIENDLALYRTLATVGTTTAVFAHETLRPVDSIEQMIKTIKRRGQHTLADDYERILGKPVSLIEKAVGSLRTFAELPLKLLKNRKRRPGVVEIQPVISELLQTFKPYLDDAQVEVRLEMPTDAAKINATVASVEAVVANILANAVAEFTTTASPPLAQPGGPASPMDDLAKVLIIRCDLSPETVHLSFIDNGTGIRGLTTEEVWLPGFSTREGGTGLGLTIVRDVVADLRGKVVAVATGELGGAEFHLTIPRVRSLSQS
ncbi:sensor histidine kinase [Nonomuraea sp. SYSU D8015]|uniref:sensor histidine kinase n=1 Tax=Nonomuraea sp. SYSU D8015 TaxID=2593644 RepID=UPI0016609870|nr:sensor histidine kinase [Nonomuraea sp. SYSU D8015]